MKKNQWLMGGVTVLLTISASAGFVDERSSQLEIRDVAKPIETTQSTPTSTVTTVNKLIETMEPPPTPATSATLPAPIIERLTIQAGQRLSVALGTWLKFQNIELSWEPSGSLPGRVRDVVIDSTWLASQTALEPTLTEVLAPFGLTAHVLRQGVTTVASSTRAPTSIVVRNTSHTRP